MARLRINKPTERKPELSRGLCYKSCSASTGGGNGNRKVEYLAASLERRLEDVPFPLRRRRDAPSGACKCGKVLGALAATSVCDLLPSDKLTNGRARARSRSKQMQRVEIIIIISKGGNINIINGNNNNNHHGR
jgi:hypothetical protein